MVILNFKKSSIGNLVYYKIPSFEETGLVKHGFSTRLGGVSSAPLYSLNLGTKKNDKKENIFKNYTLLSQALEIPIEHMVFSDQVHGDKVLKVDKSHRANNLFSNNKIVGVDGLITEEKEVALVTFYADCVPLFFIDPVQKAIGLSHAGWKGTISKIGQKTLYQMIKYFSTKPEDCLVAIGPSIGSCCFEVGGEVIEQINLNFVNPKQYYTLKDNGKYMVDLWKLNQDQLIEMGVQLKNITISDICTKCNKEIFFSHRGDNGNTGSLAALLQLI